MSCALNPSPCQKTPQRQSEHQERRRTEQPRVELVVEPAAGEHADQRRPDDHPAEHSDLGEALRDRRIAVAQPAYLTFSVLPGCFHQRVLFVRDGHVKLPPPARAPDPRWLTI